MNFYLANKLSSIFKIKIQKHPNKRGIEIYDIRYEDGFLVFKMVIKKLTSRPIKWLPCFIFPEILLMKLCVASLF